MFTIYVLPHLYFLELQCSSYYSGSQIAASPAQCGDSPCVDAPAKKPSDYLHLFSLRWLQSQRLMDLWYALSIQYLHNNPFSPVMTGWVIISSKENVIIPWWQTLECVQNQPMVHDFQHIESFSGQYQQSKNHPYPRLNAINCTIESLAVHQCNMYQEGSHTAPFDTCFCSKLRSQNLSRKYVDAIVVGAWYMEGLAKKRVSFESLPILAPMSIGSSFLIAFGVGQSKIKGVKAYLSLCEIICSGHAYVPSIMLPCWYTLQTHFFSGQELLFHAFQIPFCQKALFIWTQLCCTPCQFLIKLSDAHCPGFPLGRY